jgi:hypothetical protein
MMKEWLDFFFSAHLMTILNPTYLSSCAADNCSSLLGRFKMMQKIAVL